MQMMANLSADLKSRVRGAGGGEGGGGEGRCDGRGKSIACHEGGNERKREEMSVDGRPILPA